MSFSPTRLMQIRTSLGINKAEAARMLNLTPMGYGRYENGDRIPSYQMICHIAHIFGTSYDYLCENSDDSKPQSLVISSEQDSALFEMAYHFSELNEKNQERLLMYYRKLHSLDNQDPD